VHFRYRGTVYYITVFQPSDGSVASVAIDGIEQPDTAISLVDDHLEHSVEVRIPAPTKKGGIK
jgi:cyclic beta-1,2-glucan synthetase